MNLPIFWQLLVILAAHWVADFVCQTHWQASNKSKDNIALGRHVMNYSLVMTAAFATLGPDVYPVAYFWAITFATHFATDYVTSRISSKLYAKQDWHNFFVVIGFDQLTHQATLATTMWLLLGHR